MSSLPADLYALDFSQWKRESVRQCFAASRIHFVSSIDKVPAHAWLAVWGMRDVSAKLAVGVKVLRLEDGFLRSVGLGADLIRPMSWVVDRSGLYYDARTPSDLELILQQAAFDAALLKRANALRARIVQSRITKYNVGHEAWQAPSQASRLILVPGQVESDAALAFGAPGIRQNMALLRAVREANPQAYVVYKPHPDVVAGLRLAGENETSALRWCDEVVTEVGMDTLLDAVHEVHVMTSLAGFEALLRGKAVTCYGQPFYAGWGLTTDLLPLTRRSQRLQLDELVAGVLLVYPSYLSRSTGKVCTAEEALDDLLRWKAVQGTKTPVWRKVFRMALRKVVGVR
jgi:capsular polysaccharide export protein